jgi:D-psicose/D-tagatose/L-ribulose 3-epimerase
MQFGINTFVWVSPLTTAAIATLAPKVKALGFDVLELAIEDPAAIDVAAARG